MKKKIVGIPLAIFAVLMVIASLQELNFSGQKSDIVQDTTASVVTTDNQRFVLKEYQGKIAVFKENEQFPDEIFNVYVGGLPEIDQELIKNGITANNEHELQRLIEDYTS